MATIVSWNGSSFTVPATGEENWGGTTKVDGLLVSLATNGFQKSGGLFTLSADADFGATAGLKAGYYKSRATNVSSSGVIRLGNAEVIGWRNAANGGNVTITCNASDQIVFSGAVVVTTTLQALGILTTSASNVGIGTGTGSSPSTDSVLVVGGTGIATTSQAGVYVSPNFRSTATAGAAGVSIAAITQATVFTLPIYYGVLAQDVTKGAGSVITRVVHFYGADPTTGTNNAIYANNAAFTGNYFIHYNGTNPSTIGGVVTFTAGIKNKVSTANTSNPPTNAETESAFGAAATMGSGFTALIDDNAGHAAEYIVWSDGTKYWYVAGTACP